MQYLCNKHGLDAFYPTDPARAGDGRQRDVLPDRHALPAVARATYPALGFPQYPGEVGSLGRRRRAKAKAQQDAAAALAEPLDVVPRFFLDGKPFIGGDAPSIADIRLAATLEFLHAIDYAVPGWAREYMARDGGGPRRRVLGAGATCGATSSTSSRRPPP